MTEDDFLKYVIALCTHFGPFPSQIEENDLEDKWIADLWREAMARQRKPAAQEPVAALRAALECAQRFISAVPHGENCYLDPNHCLGQSCECGKDSALECVESALENTSVAQEPMAWLVTPNNPNIPPYASNREAVTRLHGATVQPLYAVPVAVQVGSWTWLRGVIRGIPRRAEKFSAGVDPGQTFSYVQLDEVLGWIDEGEKRTAAAQGQSPEKPAAAKTQTDASIYSPFNACMYRAGCRGRATKFDALYQATIGALHALAAASELRRDFLDAYNELDAALKKARGEE